MCEADERILKEEEEKIPAVLVHELAESSVDLAIRYWTNTDVFWNTRFEMIENIKNRFDEEGIEIPFPHRVLISAVD